MKSSGEEVDVDAAMKELESQQAAKKKVKKAYCKRHNSRRGDY